MVAIIKQLNERLADAMGWYVKEGQQYNSYKTFLPYYFFDTAYQEWIKYKKGRNFSHEAGMYAERINNAFKSYFAYFRSLFNEEQQNYLLEITDEFEEFIAEHVFKAKITYMNAIAEYTAFDKQTEMALVWAVNILSYIAQGWYGMVTPKTRKTHSVRHDHYIDTVIANTKNLCKAMYDTENHTVTEDRVNKIDFALETVTNQTVLWVQAKHSEEITNNETVCG